MALNRDDVILNGKYQTERLLGEGGMARVWLADEPALGRRVAIKEPLTAETGKGKRQELQRRFRQEVKLGAQLDRAGVPHIVRTYTLETLPGGTQLLVMEYLDGGSLADLMARHAEGLPVERALAIAQDVLEALHGLHELPTSPVHRDVKPENILLDSQGRARLADFGLAQISGASGRTRLAGVQHPGTPLYMAPEQGRSPDPLTPSADLYALGCVLFEMLTGQRYKRVRPGTRASALRPEVARWLDEVLICALEEDPWERYTEAGEMAAALAGVGEPAGREVEETPSRQSDAPRAPIWQRIGIEMVRIPEGEFLYGEESQSVNLPEYCLSRTLVTNAHYKAFVDSTGHRSPGHWIGGTIPGGKEDHPVVTVSWKDAAAFCHWAGLRLPTEQEWEKGARGTDGREYPWGDEWEPGRCNTKEAGIGDTTPVGHYSTGASPCGLLDMAGNVFEWCETWYDSGRDSKVLRGGSWFLHARNARSAHRYWQFRDRRDENIGFRCGFSPTSSR